MARWHRIHSRITSSFLFIILTLSVLSPLISQSLTPTQVIEGESQIIIPAPFPASHPLRIDWSPDGKYLVLAVGTRLGQGGFAVYRFYESNRSLVLSWYTTIPGPRGIAWSHDGSKVILTYDAYSTNPNIQVFWRNGTLIWEKRTGDQFLYAPAWSPDDKMITVGGRENYGDSSIRHYYYGCLYVFNASTGEILWNKTENGTITSLLWPSNLDLIMTAGYTGKIRVFTPDGRFINETEDLGYTIQNMRLSPDGSKIAVGVRWHWSSSELGRIVIMDTHFRKIWERRTQRADVWGIA